MGVERTRGPGSPPFAIAHSVDLHLAVPCESVNAHTSKTNEEGKQQCFPSLFCCGVAGASLLEDGNDTIKKPCPLPNEAVGDNVVGGDGDFTRMGGICFVLMRPQVTYLIRVPRSL